MTLPVYRKKTSSKKHYAVFVCHQGEGGCYGTQKLRRLVGETWAVSPEQACNNVRYRTRGRSPSYYVIGDVLDEGSASVFYEAEEI